MEVQCGFQYGRPRKVPENNGIVFSRSTTVCNYSSPSWGMHLLCTLLRVKQLTPPSDSLSTWIHDKQPACTMRRSVLFSVVSKGTYFWHRQNWGADIRQYMLWYDMIWYDMIWYDIFNCKWVATLWHLFSTHIHTNNTGNITKQTIHKTTQKYIEQHKDT